MLYTIAIQNLRLQVSVPDSADTAALDKVIREFNDHLMTFNGGKPVELFESKEIKLLIFTLISSNSSCFFCIPRMKEISVKIHSRNAKKTG